MISTVLSSPVISTVFRHQYVGGPPRALRLSSVALAGLKQAIVDVVSDVRGPDINAV